MTCWVSSAPICRILYFCLVPKLHERQKVTWTNSTPVHQTYSTITTSALHWSTKKLKLWSLKERRNRSDLIEVFKMAKNISPIPLSTFFELNTDSRTRGLSLKLVKHHCRMEIRRRYFSERAVNRWKSLEQDTVSAKTVNVSSPNYRRRGNQRWACSFMD